MKYLTQEQGVDLAVEAHKRHGTFAVPIPAGPGGVLIIGSEEGHSIVSLKLILNTSGRDVRMVKLSNDTLFPETEERTEEGSSQQNRQARSQTAGR